MLASSVLLLAFGSPQLSRVDKSNYASFFAACQRRKAYLEAPEVSRKEPQFLGYITDSKYDTKGVAHEFGESGNKYNRKSIWNNYGDFGSKYSDRSPWNEYSRTPVEILCREDRKTYILGYLTANEYARVAEPTLPKVHPKYLAYWVDRGSDIPK